MLDLRYALRSLARARGFTLAEVLGQHNEVHATLLDYVGTAPEALFTRETRFRRRLRLDCYGHYPIHAKAIAAWRRLAL